MNAVWSSCPGWSGSVSPSFDTTPTPPSFDLFRCRCSASSLLSIFTLPHHDSIQARALGPGPVKRQRISWILFDPQQGVRLRGRWRFDKDDEPTVGLEGADEQDRVLIDDYDPK
ncbi:hypothetical protein M405DRAFT_60889 [Rhizopogon salebrosus TDB-379]|nr:hypothetical protein M405DRAFT_60889 [Rhizopogon salebrosus TDB-379]